MDVVAHSTTWMRIIVHATQVSQESCTPAASAWFYLVPTFKILLDSAWSTRNPFSILTA